MLVVQSDAYNGAMPHVVVAEITSNLARAGDPQAAAKSRNVPFPFYVPFPFCRPPERTATMHEVAGILSPLIQSLAYILPAIVGATLAYLYGKAMEPHKFEVRKREIRYSKLIDKTFAAIESINDSQANWLNTLHRINDYSRKADESDDPGYSEALARKIVALWDEADVLSQQTFKLTNQLGIYLTIKLARAISAHNEELQDFMNSLMARTSSLLGRKWSGEIPELSAMSNYYMRLRKSRQKLRLWFYLTLRLDTKGRSKTRRKPKP